MLVPTPEQTLTAFRILGEPVTIPSALYEERFGDALNYCEDDEKPALIITFRDGYWIADHGADAPGGRFELCLGRTEWRGDDLNPLVCYLAAWDAFEWAEEEPLLADFNAEIY